MAYDTALADRLRTLLTKRDGIVEKKMFGGLAFLLNGNMCVGVNGDNLIVRLDPTQTDKALAEPHTRVFDLTGRPMKGWVLVEPGGLGNDAALAKWVKLGEAYAGSLPPK